MQFKECLRLDNDQSFTPIEKPGELTPEGACSSFRTPRPHLAFLKHSELFAKEKILGDDGGARGKEQPYEREQPKTQHIELWSIERLVEYPRNPRKNDSAVDRMCSSIREFGFKIPYLVRSDGQVVDGAVKPVGIATAGGQMSSVRTKANF